MEYAIFFLALFLVISMIFHFIRKTYDSMLYGTIVGKYKGNKISGGYIVVEMETRVANDYSIGTNLIKVQGTYEVPSEYYDTVQLGDKGVFPK